MTNREWLAQYLSGTTSSGAVAKLFAKNTSSISTNKTCPCHDCGMRCGTAECEDQIEAWLDWEYTPPKRELTQAQLCEAFEVKFAGRRAISMDEVRAMAKELFR